MLVLGVDPGLTGAMSLLCSTRGLLECADVPIEANGTASGAMRNWVDVARFQAILADWSQRHEFAQHEVMAVVERPIPMPTLPAQTVASQFDTFGVIRALVSAKVGAMGLTIVNPRDWKKLFGLKGGKEDKNRSRECCLRLYPSAPVTRVKDHNRAESVLIGHWLLRGVA
jgi:crossover junction endodeoxyribonuclease RuvC